MADTTQIEEGLRTFREHFESTRMGLSIAASPELVNHVVSAVDITVAKNWTIDLVRILALQTQPSTNTVPSPNGHANHLANLSSIGLSIFTDSFDIRLAIPLIEQVMNNEPEEKIYSAVARLAVRARLLLTSSTQSRKVASDVQFSASSQLIESDSSISHEPEFRALKRVKLGHGDPRREKDGIGMGRKYDIETSDRDDLYKEPALEQSPILQYRPLLTARREIRLLVLHPSEDILDLFSYSCTLIHVSMDEDPGYEALSYVWGSEANKEKILVDGCQFSVTANLAAALNYLYDNDSPRKLWVDAICINQDDIPERSHQVQNMTEIYTKARNVVVWIGILGITTQNLLHRVENPEDDDQSPEHLQRWTASGARINPDPDPSALNEEDMRLLSELAQNPWFGRIWVIQEVAVAREVIVQTGCTTISWLAFSTALEKCSNKHEMKSVIEAVSTINIIRTARSQKPYYMDLFVLLERFRHCLATDERDKVFALLGLASSSLAQERVVQVTPDYSKPAVAIYRSLTRQYINKRKNLDIICHATLSNYTATPS